MRYARIKLADATRAFYLRITVETDRMLSGWEVDREGNEVAPAGFERRLRIIEKKLIAKRTPMRMNNKYGHLEVDK